MEQITKHPFISDKLHNIIAAQFQFAVEAKSCVAIDFCDPFYSATKGGFHKVQIELTPDGNRWAVARITDYEYAGTPPAEVLTPALRFDFAKNEFIHKDVDLMTLDAVSETYKRWENSFVMFFGMKAYEVSATQYQTLN